MLALVARENFLEDLNVTYRSGVLTCDFEVPEFKAFLKWLMKNYFRYAQLVSSHAKYCN